jgi:hypothetical protein
MPLARDPDHQGNEHTGLPRRGRPGRTSGSPTCVGDPSAPLFKHSLGDAESNPTAEKCGARGDVARACGAT